VQPQSNPFGASREDHQAFVERFRQGPRAVSDEEAASRYEQVAPSLPPDVYQQSAQEVFAQLTSEQRMQLGQALIQSAREQGQSFPDVNQDGIDDRLQDPDYLAQTTTQVERQQPGLLGRILRGGAARRSTAEGTPADSMPTATPQVGASGMLGSPMARGILGGIAAAGLMNMLTGPHYYSGGLFGPPVMGGFFGGGPMFGGYGFGEGYEEGYEEGLEEGFEGDFGGGDFGGGDFGGGDF
jgi:hypothetical protein